MILAILLSPISAVLGRAAGMTKDATAKPTWIPVWLRHRWVRPLGCSLCVLAPLFSAHPSWWFVPALGALYGMLTTYWDEVPFNKGMDNFWMAGFGCGLAGFFLVTFFPWWIILIRAFALAILWGGINLLANKNDWTDGTEEMVRYGVLCLATLFIV